MGEPMGVAMDRFVTFPQQWWYPACMAHDLGRSPQAITLMDIPLVLFRDGAGAAHALLDRCPHRNVPLSLGRVHARRDAGVRLPRLAVRRRRALPCRTRPRR